MEDHGEREHDGLVGRILGPDGSKSPWRDPAEQDVTTLILRCEVLEALLAMTGRALRNYDLGLLTTEEFVGLLRQIYEEETDQ